MDEGQWRATVEFGTGNLVHRPKAWTNFGCVSAVNIGTTAYAVCLENGFLGLPFQPKLPENTSLYLTSGLRPHKPSDSTLNPMVAVLPQGGSKT